jgi:hypothetical protein
MHPSMQIPGEPFLGEAHGHGDNERHKKKHYKVDIITGRVVWSANG